MVFKRRGAFSMDLRCRRALGRGVAISEYLRGLRGLVGTTLLHVPSVAAFLRDDDGRVLLVQHAGSGVWVCPGGAIDPDEAPQDAVVREAWEETGLHVQPVALCGVYGGPHCRVRYDNGDEVTYVITVFACRLLGGTLRPDGEETVDARWVAAAEFPSLNLSGWSRVVLPQLMSGAASWIPPVRWTPPPGERL